MIAAGKRIYWLPLLYIVAAIREDEGVVKLLARLSP